MGMTMKNYFKNIYTQLLLTTAILLTNSSNLVAMEQIFADDFESGDTSSWDISTGETPVKVTENQVHMGSSAAQIDSVNAALIKRVNRIRDGQLSLYCYISTSENDLKTEITGSKSCAMGVNQDQHAQGELRIGIKDNQVYADIWQNENAIILVDVFSLYLGNLPCDRWHRLSINYDFTTQTAVFAVNDVPVYEQQVALPEISYIGIGNLIEHGENATHIQSETNPFYIDTVGLVHSPGQGTNIPWFNNGLLNLPQIDVHHGDDSIVSYQAILELKSQKPLTFQLKESELK